MIDFVGLSAVAAAFFIVTVSPGPATIAAATVSMSSGRKNGILFGAGLSCGLAFWGVIAATGLGAILQGSAHMLTALKLFGGAYLLWLAYKSARSALQKSDAINSLEDTGKWFRRGLVLNLSNPKAVFAWMAALSMGMNADQGAPQVIAATAICMVLGSLCYAGYTLAFSLSGVMAAYQRIRRWVDSAVAGLFAIAGIGMIRSVFAKQ